METLSENLPYGFIILDEENESCYLNEKAREYLEIYTPFNARSLKPVFYQQEREGQENVERHYFELKKIQQKVFLINAFIDDSLHFITMIDLGKIRHTDYFDAIKRLNAEIENIIESTYDGIILSDKEGRIYRVNQGVERLSGGIKRSDIIGKTAAELESEGFILSQTKKVLGKNPLMLTQKLRTGVEIFITSTRVFNKNGDVLFNVANLRNIDELNKLKKEVEEVVDLNQRYLVELQELREKFMRTEKIVVKDSKMKQVMDNMLKVAKSNASVFITGESGVGKEIVAKIIHQLSEKRGNPFVSVNCGAIPEPLLESELFGYEEGAFTGARKKGKVGLMEVASGGTLFLDEIAELPLSSQIKLLRAIEEQKIYRLGGIDPVEINVRFIAATNVKIEEHVSKGLFRQDLYYRLNVLPILIPPLRERYDDIIPLAFDFLKKYNSRYGKNRVLTLEASKLLESYHWPGNVRELENLIERLVIISDEREITAEDLPDCFKHQEVNFKISAAEHALSGNNDHSYKESLEAFEKSFFAAALQKHGDINTISLATGLHRATVYRKINKYRLSIEE